MGIDLKKNEKLSKIVTVVLVGILLLVIAIPVKNNSSDNTTEISGENSVGDYNTYANYYEEKLKAILENSYGKGTMQVMVHLADGEKTGSFYSYSTSESEYTVDGVLIVADVNSEQAVSDITYAVCALFNLPTHKCAVLLKN